LGKGAAVLNVLTGQGVWLGSATRAGLTVPAGHAVPEELELTAGRVTPETIAPARGVLRVTTFVPDAMPVVMELGTVLYLNKLFCISSSSFHL
jgi:hypothetical protein